MSLFFCCRPLYHQCIVQVHFRLVTLPDQEAVLSTAFVEQLSATTSVGLFCVILKTNDCETI